MQFKLFLVIAMLTGSSASASAADASCPLKACPGKISNPYEDDHYKFATSSRVYKNKQHYVFETCAQNNGNKILDFNWLIPGPHSWIPPGCATVSSRLKSTATQLDGQVGCIIYGNSGLTTRLEFLPHESDKDMLSKETPDCVASTTADIQLQDLPPSEGSETVDEAVQVSGEVFAPSLSDDPDHSLNKIAYQVLLQNDSKKGTFTHNINVQVSSAYSDETTQYNKGFYIQPPPSVDYLYATDARPVGQPIFLADEAKLSFESKSPLVPKLASALYEILSADGKPVAGIWVPTLIEAK